MSDSRQVHQARRELGRKLAALRASAGLSQQALAQAVHYTRSTVGNVEVGRQNAPRAFWSSCDDVLRAGGQLRDAYDTLHALRAAGRRSEAQAIDIGGRRAVPSASRALTAYIPFLPAALDRPALDWLIDADPGSRLGSSAEAGPVDEAQVAAAAATMERFRHVDHTEGAGVVYRQAEQFVATDLRLLLAARPADQQVAQRLHQLASRSYELIGYQAVDLGADGLAQRHYLHALALARAVGERAFGAYLLAVSLGHLALHCGHPAAGLRMAQTAIQGASGAVTPAVRAAVQAVLARAHARLGDERACTVALTAAETGLAASDAGSEPAWIGYFTAAYLADEVAHCLFDLDRHHAAQREVRQAIASVGAERVRRLAIDTALLASSLARAGQVDEACAYGHDAVDLAARTRSMRGVQRVAQMRVDLAPFVGHTAVTEFVDHFHATLPAAA
jgi:DNA-binding XRE family transcriptional regulator